MASFKVKFRQSSVPDNEGAIYIQLIHNCKVRQLGTDYRVHPSEWDESRSTVTTKQGGERLAFIMSLRDRIRWDIERLVKIDKRINERELEYTVDDIVEEFRRYANEYSIFNYMESVIARLIQNGHYGTSRAYRSTLLNFKKFRKDEDIMLDCITPEIMEDYAV